MSEASSCVVVVGKESVGKSQLISSLTGQQAYSDNFRGTTISCEAYPGVGFTFVDTPGIVRQSDSVTTRLAIERLRGEDTVLLVVQATRLDQDLDDLLPMLEGKRGVVAVTFWDKIRPSAPGDVMTRLSSEIGAAVVPLDARDLGTEQRSELIAALGEPRPFAAQRTEMRTGWRVEPPRGIMDRPAVGVLLAALLVFAPAVAAVWIANSFAALVDAALQAWLAALAARLTPLPALLEGVLKGPYGLFTMGPLMFVWAAPTVVIYAFFLGAYKASGLIDRINAAMHPVMRPFGLAGRDLARVLMGFGCNVPAVVNTRACSACSRGPTIAAIAFGSACSYQLGATLSVFGAARAPWLVLPYLVFLAASTLVYLRLTSPREARSRLNVLMSDGRSFLQWPRWTALWREARASLSLFFRKAIPIFLAITVIASVLDSLGALRAVSKLLTPAMRLFNLPAEAALPVVMASIRKDGILLFSNPEALSRMNPGQILTGVYLAGVFLPCLVTVLTIAREQSVGLAARLLARHVVAGLAFSLVLAWGTRLIWASAL